MVQTILEKVGVMDFRQRQKNFVRGKNVLMTGATDGLGVPFAEQLGVLGCKTLIVLARNEGKAEKLVERVREMSNGKTAVEIIRCDLESMMQVQDAARAILDMDIPIHVVILNAGIVPSPIIELTPEAIEKTFAVNVLSQFVLIHTLMIRIVESKPARIVVTCSQQASVLDFKLDMSKIQPDKLEGVFGSTTYARTKLMNMVFVKELSRRLQGEVLVNGFGPGIVNTSLGSKLSPVLSNLVQRLTGWLMRTPEVGATFGLYLAAHPDVDFSGMLLHDGYTGMPQNFEPKEMQGDAADESVAEEFWDYCKNLSDDLLG